MELLIYSCEVFHFFHAMETMCVCHVNARSPFKTGRVRAIVNLLKREAGEDWNATVSITKMEGWPERSTAPDCVVGVHICCCSSHGVLTFI